MKHIFALWLAISFISTLSSPSMAQSEGAKDEPQFEMVSIPSVLRTPTERAEYLVMHYWDRFNFNDMRFISHSEVTEQALANFIDLKNHVSKDMIVASMKNLMAKAEANKRMFAHICALMEKYLYEPESPLEDEELLIPVLEYMVNSSSLDESDKIRPEMLLRLVSRNRIGKEASDFKYSLANGKSGEMSLIDSDYLILFFNDPDCLECNEAGRQILASFVIGDFINRGLLKILSIYPYDNVEGWKQRSNLMPKEWINAYDDGCEIMNNEIYDIKSTPTLYLLSKQKRVLLKNCGVNDIEMFLSNGRQY